jgi:hypothetical protein
MRDKMMVNLQLEFVLQESFLKFWSVNLYHLEFFPFRPYNRRRVVSFEQSFVTVRQFLLKYEV